MMGIVNRAVTGWRLKWQNKMRMDWKYIFSLKNPSQNKWNIYLVVKKKLNNKYNHVPLGILLSNTRQIRIFSQMKIEYHLF